MHVFDLNILDMLDVKKVILRHIFRGLFPFLCDEYITVGIDQSQEKKSSRVLLIHLGRPLSFLTVCKGDYKGLSTTLMLDLFDISSFRKDPSNPPKGTSFWTCLMKESHCNKGYYSRVYYQRRIQRLFQNFLWENETFFGDRQKCYNKHESFKGYQSFLF